MLSSWKHEAWPRRISSIQSQIIDRRSVYLRITALSSSVSPLRTRDKTWSNLSISLSADAWIKSCNIALSCKAALPWASFTSSASWFPLSYVCVYRVWPLKRYDTFYRRTWWFWPTFQGHLQPLFILCPRSLVYAVTDVCRRNLLAWQNPYRIRERSALSNVWWDRDASRETSQSFEPSFVVAGSTIAVFLVLSKIIFP